MFVISDDNNSTRALTEEFVEKFLSKNNSSASTEINSNSAELKIMENFYKNLYEKIKLLLKHDKDINVKINVSNFIFIDWILLTVIFKTTLTD